MAPWCSLILGKLVSPGLIKLIVVRENCNLCLIVQESSRGGCISKLKSYFIVCSFYFMSTPIIFLFLDNLPLYLLWQLSSLQTKSLYPLSQSITSVHVLTQSQLPLSPRATLLISTLRLSFLLEFLENLCVTRGVTLLNPSNHDLCMD